LRASGALALPAGPDNPSLNAFVMEETTLRTERAARRDLDLTTARRWLVVNPEARNALGQAAAYLLAPGDSSVPYLHPDSPIRRRAGFVNHHFWATAFDPRSAARRARIRIKASLVRAAGMDGRTARSKARTSSPGTFGLTRAAAGRVAGDERHDDRLQAGACRILQSQPRAGRAEEISHGKHGNTENTENRRAPHIARSRRSVRRP
jgi:hypothetical protein